ncbi:MAG: helix-turn-helix domain-containing protein [Deltaproteobacteria bacterium]|nr:helix-turn-helix domain-containing protein [Deltaproteobacteria bacterium]
MSAYSMDLREKVVAAYERGGVTKRDIAARFGVSYGFVRNLLGRRRRGESIAPKPHGGGRQAVYQGPRLEALKKAVCENPDATLEDLLAATGGHGSIMAVHRALGRLGCRRKKSHSAPVSRTVPTSKPGGRLGAKKRTGSTRRT